MTDTNIHTPNSTERKQKEARELRAAGIPIKEIAIRMGYSLSWTHKLLYGDAPKDPMGPNAVDIGYDGETPEHRAFRRFPITSHKPRFD